MTIVEMKEAERTLSLKEKKYCTLMRKSFETALKDRERADQLHGKALDLYEEIIDTRIALDIELN